MRAEVRILLAAIPIVALTVAIPLANRDEPHVFGLPFLLAWIAGWVFLTPLFVWGIGKIERRW